jgi:hypothetical protein
MAMLPDNPIRAKIREIITDNPHSWDDAWWVLLQFVIHYLFELVRVPKETKCHTVGRWSDTASTARGDAVG